MITITGDSEVIKEITNVLKINNLDYQENDISYFSRDFIPPEVITIAIACIPFLTKIIIEIIRKSPGKRKVAVEIENKKNGDIKRIFIEGKSTKETEELLKQASEIFIYNTPEENKKKKKES